jgi:chromosome segregation ATPase
MSEDTETESNSPEKNNPGGYENLDIKELQKIPFIKELLVKLDVLKNGIIKERKDKKILEDQIKQLEGELSSKTEQLKNMSLEKMEIEKKLALEKKQLEKKEEGFLKMASILNSSGKNTGKFGININKEDETKKEEDDTEKQLVSLMTNEEVMKLNEEITQLKFENETILKKLNMSLEESENRKLEFRTINKALTDKVKTLGEEIEKLKKEKSEFEKTANLNSSMNVQTMREKQHFDALLNEYKKNKEEAIRQLDACLEKCSKLAVENQNYKDTMKIRQEEAAKIAEELAKYKNMMDKVNLRNQMYHVTKLGKVSNVDIDIYFGEGKDGNYIMRIDDKKLAEFVNIQDVLYIKKIDSNSNKVQLSYMLKSKKYVMNVLVDDFVVEEFIDAYKNFYHESVKMQNELRF